MKFELRKTYGDTHKLIIKSNPSMSINFNKIGIINRDECPALLLFNVEYNQKDAKHHTNIGKENEELVRAIIEYSEKYLIKIVGEVKNDCKHNNKR